MQQKKEAGSSSVELKNEGESTGNHTKVRVSVRVSQNPEPLRGTNFSQCRFSVVIHVESNKKIKKYYRGNNLHRLKVLNLNIRHLKKMRGEL